MRPNVTNRYAGPSPDELERAARLCFDDKANDEQIAAELGICRRTLARWKHRPVFRATFAALNRALEDEWRARIRVYQEAVLLGRVPF